MMTSCMICRCTQSEFVCTKNGFTVVRCQACSFVYADRGPIRSEDELFRLYQGGPFIPPSKLKVFSKHLRYWSRLIRVERHTIVYGRFLDIGCAHGYWGWSVRRSKKWQYLGIDLNRAVLDYARSLGLNVEHDTVFQHAFPNEEFAMVTMTHVLEHLFDPIETLVEVHRIMKKNALLVVEVPDINHPRMQRRIRADRAYEPPGHLSYFSSKTLKGLLKLTGFSPLVVGRTILKPYMYVFARKAERGAIREDFQF